MVGQLADVQMRISLCQTVEAERDPAAEMFLGPQRALIHPSCENYE